VREKNKTYTFKVAVAAKAPAINNKESPGRNGINTIPVSIKIMKKRII
jgi:hypothetical protein